MSKYDELLARLDDVGPEEILKDISAHYRLVDDAAAAIRELRAAAAESRLCDAFEETRERCAKVCNEMAVKSGNSLVISACGIAANRIRTLAPDRTVAGQPDLGSSSEPLVTKATSLDTHERSVLNREDAVGSVTACRDEPASPLAPERTVAGQNPDNVSVGGDVRAPSNGSLGASCTSSAPAAAPVAHSKSQYKRLVTQGAIAPVSPLLPGLERAAEIADKEWRRLKAHGWEGDAFIALQLAEEIRAEISRLKGEGRDHEMY